MYNTKPYNLLLVAGDYELVQQVSRALSSARFFVQTAFNHREALYLLSHGEFNVVLVDAAMIDRHTSAVTLLVLKDKVTSPVIGFALDRTAQVIVEQAGVPAINVADVAVIRRTLARVLGMPVEGDTGLLFPHTDDPTMTTQFEEFNTLLVLAKSLTEVLDLPEVLNRVVEAARQITRADEALILLPEGDELYLRARVGMGVEIARNFRVKVRDTLAGQVFYTGRPTLIGKAGPQKPKTEYFVNALLYIPIILRGEVMGVLGVNNHTKDDEFHPRDQQFLEVLASFAAVSIQNARIHSESLTRNRDLEMLVMATQALNTTLSLEDALGNVCQQMARTLRVDHIEIFNWDKLGDRLTQQARYDDSTWPMGRGPLVDLNEFVALRALMETQGREVGHLWVDDHHPDEDNVRAWLARLGVKTVLIIPVYTDEHLLGVVRCFYINPPQSAPADDVMHEIQSSALQVVADLFNKSDQRPITPVMRRLIGTIRQQAGASWCDVSLPLQSDSALSITVRLGVGAWLSSPQPVISLTDYTDLRDSMNAGQPVDARQGARHVTPGGLYLLNRMNARAIIGVPLMYNNQARGLVVFASTGKERVFIEREVMMARAIVSQAAIALENARLVHDLELSLDELKITQQRLVQTARLSAMGELAAVVAHQMNNPLTTIIVDTELMLLDEPEDSPRRESLMAIARTGKRAANVARRLLAMAHPSETDTSPDYIDIADSVRGIVSVLQAHFEHNGISMTLKFPTGAIPPVRAIKGRLDDIWLNLLMNAHDALHNHPDAQMGVEVDYHPEAHQVIVVIWDNGVGIPPSMQSQIFLPFFTTKPVGEGTGLGLHICREIVESAGGSIHVESEPGKLTRFVVQLPVQSLE